MRIRANLLSLGRTLFRRHRLEADLDEELRAYVDELTRRKVRAGRPEADARREALVETGGLEQVKERVRDVRTGRWLDTVMADVRYALRGLRRSPGFTAVAVLTLALGVGANVAIFSVIDAVLLRPAPVTDLAGLVMLWETDRQTGTTREPASVPDFVDFRARAGTVKPIVGMVAGEANMTPARGEAQRLAVLRVSPDLLPMLGFHPIVGRGFTAGEDRPGGPSVVLISESLWTSTFGRDANVEGRVLHLDGVPYTVVGVVPDVSDFGILQILTAAAYSRSFTDRGDGMRVDAWLPLQADPQTSPRETHGVFLLGRLASGVSPAAADRDLAAVAADLERSYPSSNKGRGVHVERLADVVFGPVRQGFILLLGAAVFVLIVACVNVASLLLARGAVRAREVAVRSALGAGTTRLVRQFAVESIVLAVIAGLAGVAVAWATLRGLVAIAPADIPRLSSAGIDWRALAVTFVLLLGVGVVVGLVPTFQARRLDVQGALVEAGGARLSGGRHSQRQRRVLVVVEVSLAVVLLVGAGLLIRSFWRLEHVDPGFRTGGVLKVEYQLPRTRYPARFAVFPDFKEMHAFTAAIERAASAIPGVQSVAVAGNHPLDPGFTNSFAIVGREAESQRFPEISVRRVTPGYFGTVGLSLVRGRLLGSADATHAPAVLVINQAAARRFFPGADPLSAKIRFWGVARTIVGVVADERFHGLAEAAPIAVYAPLAQAPSVNGAGALLVRTARDPAALTSAIRRVFRQVDPELAVFAVEPLDRTVSRSLSARRFLMVLVALFAATALALAAIGIAGLLAYSVAQRTREFGIRIALGARPRQVVSAVVRDACALTACGLVIGLAGALLLGRFLASQLYGIAATDPVTFAAVGCFLGVAAVAAASVPASRVTKIDPTIALRTE